MPTIYDKVEAAYLAHAMKTYNAVARPSDIARLLEKFPEIVEMETESINTYFLEQGTLEGLATKYRDN